MKLNVYEVVMTGDYARHLSRRGIAAKYKDGMTVATVDALNSDNARSIVRSKLPAMRLDPITHVNVK